MSSKENPDNFKDFLKDSVRLQVDFSKTDQRKGIAPPPVEKPFIAEAKRISLPSWKTIRQMGEKSISQTIEDRVSVRRFSQVPLTIEQLTYLLWATQGVRDTKNSGITLRTVPSAGARHAFETYLAIHTVTDVEPGLYRYLPVEHELVFEFAEPQLAQNLGNAAFGQNFVGKGAVTFIWSVIPYRMEWRYGPASYKVLAIDVGHVAQNLYMACSGIGLGTCAVAAYDQREMDALLHLDGEEEFTIYLAPVGVI